MTTLLHRYVEFVVKRPWRVIAALMILTVGMGLQIGRLKIDMDPDNWSPQAHPYVQTTAVIEKTFDGTNVMMVGIVPKSGNVYEPRTLAKIERIQRGIERIPNAIQHNVLSLAARKV
jgi:predicted RND superfamily exporter protein